MDIDKELVERVLKENREINETKEEKYARLELEKNKIKDESSEAILGGSVVVIILFFILFFIFRSCGNDNNTITNNKTSYKGTANQSVVNTNDCVELKRKWSDCINRSIAGQACLPGTDIVLPDRCL